MSKAGDALNLLSKWRMVFASWQLGTRSDTDPESQAVRDAAERTLILRAEQNALTQLLVAKGVFTAEEWDDQVALEAQYLNEGLERRFPGFRATPTGMTINPQVARKTTEGWRP